MTIKIGNSSIKRIQLGSSIVKSAYLGNVLVYGQQIDTPYEPQKLTQHIITMYSIHH